MQHYTFLAELIVPKNDLKMGYVRFKLSVFHLLSEISNTKWPVV